MDNIERMARLLVEAKKRRAFNVALGLHDLGYTIVPREATEEMMRAGNRTSAIWRSMIVAAEQEDA